jgi:hypothetical protein
MSVSRYPPITASIVQTNFIGPIDTAGNPLANLKEVPCTFLPEGTAVTGTGTRGAVLGATNTFCIPILAAGAAAPVSFSFKIPVDCVQSVDATIYAQVLSSTTDATATARVNLVTQVTVAPLNAALPAATASSVVTKLAAVGFVANAVYTVPLATITPSDAGVDGIVTCMLSRETLPVVVPPWAVYGGVVHFVNAVMRYVSNGTLTTLALDATTL